MKNLQKLVKYIRPLINKPLPSAKLVNNKLYILYIIYYKMASHNMNFYYTDEELKRWFATDIGSVIFEEFF